MSKYDNDLYNILTNEDSDTSRELNYKLFGDNEWSGVDRANYLDNLRDRIEADSYQGGA
jgi:hypothetical protein